MPEDILLTLISWPKTASRSSLNKAISLATLLDAHLTCAVAEPRVPFPVAFHLWTPRKTQAVFLKGSVAGCCHLSGL